MEDGEIETTSGYWSMMDQCDIAALSSVTDGIKSATLRKVWVALLGVILGSSMTTSDLRAEAVAQPCLADKIISIPAVKDIPLLTFVINIARKAGMEVSDQGIGDQLITGPAFADRALSDVLEEISQGSNFSAEVKDCHVILSLASPSLRAYELRTPTAALPTALPVALPTALPVALPTALPVTLPTALPVTLPTALPVTLPTALPVTLPAALPVTLPAALPVTLPAALPVTLPAALPAPPTDRMIASTQPRSQQTDLVNLMLDHAQKSGRSVTMMGTPIPIKTLIPGAMEMTVQELASAINATDSNILHVTVTDRTVVLKYLSLGIPSIRKELERFHEQGQFFVLPSPDTNLQGSIKESKRAKQL